MANLIFANGQIQKYVRQVCDCSESYPTSRIEFGTTTWKTKEEMKTMLIFHTDICNKCRTPYNVWIDTSNLFFVTNIGDENA